MIWIELYCVCVVISIEKCSKNYNLAKRKKQIILLRFLIFTMMLVLFMFVFVLILHVQCYFLSNYNVLWLLLLLVS